MAVFLLSVLADELKGSRRGEDHHRERGPANVAIQSPDSPLTRPIWRLLVSKKTSSIHRKALHKEI
jgi:hypothetical protein